MPLPRGRTIPLSRGRKIVSDLMNFSRSVAQVAVEREIYIPEVAIARMASQPRIGWYPILLKAFALGTSRIPDLRRSLLTFPYQRLYEHPSHVAAVAIEREVDGEPGVLSFHIRSPEAMPLTAIDARIKTMKTSPVHQVGEFRRMLLLSRLPRPLRRFLWWLGLRVSGSWRQKFWGTFGATSIATAGATPLFMLCPLTSVFSFGPVGNDGSVVLRLGFDHRVLDGVAAARGLVETENALRHELLAELRSLAEPQRLAI